MGSNGCATRMRAKREKIKLVVKCCLALVRDWRLEIGDWVASRFVPRGRKGIALPAEALA